MHWKFKEGEKKLEVMNAKCLCVIIKSWENNKLHLLSIYLLGYCSVQVHRRVYPLQQHKISLIYFLFFLIHVLIGTYIHSYRCYTISLPPGFFGVIHTLPGMPFLQPSAYPGLTDILTFSPNVFLKTSFFLGWHELLFNSWTSKNHSL